jgi:predicted nucleic acid-binding protein
VTLARRHAIDTNLYIDALRTDDGHSALSAFQSAFTSSIVISAVVVQELRAGVRSKAHVAVLESQVIGPFERQQRVITPSYWAWKESGRLLAELVAKGDWISLPRSFVNDVLLAMSCREAGVVLVTSNLRDFERIARLRKFDFVAPWPGRSKSR